MEKGLLHIFLFSKDYRTMTSGWQGAPYFRRHGRELVSKPASSLKKRCGSYRRTTPLRFPGGICTFTGLSCGAPLRLSWCCHSALMLLIVYISVVLLPWGIHDSSWRFHIASIELSGCSRSVVLVLLSWFQGVFMVPSLCNNGSFMDPFNDAFIEFRDAFMLPSWSFIMRSLCLHVVFIILA